jgi:hypothetical protein
MDGDAKVLPVRGSRGRAASGLNVKEVNEEPNDGRIVHD